MPQRVFPTKGNLIQSKKTLALAKVGFDLLDRKRNILIREMVSLIDRAARIQREINTGYERAYMALQKANVAHGLISGIAESIPQETGLNITSRSVMGVELPAVRLEAMPRKLSYGFVTTSSLVDEAYIEFDHVKTMTAELAEVENSVYRLAYAIKKTQKRANALKNIVIPQLTGTIKFINDSLEEKDREEFSRMKVIKAKK